jgi:hypothetical protein
MSILSRILPDPTSPGPPTVPITPTRYGSAGFATSGIIVAPGPRRLVDLHGLVAAAVIGARWLHLFDALAVPANGSVPSRAPLYLPVANTTFSRPLAFGDPFTTGIVWACSTTEATLTLTLTADLWIDAWHIPP